MPNFASFTTLEVSGYADCLGKLGHHWVRILRPMNSVCHMTNDIGLVIHPSLFLQCIKIGSLFLKLLCGNPGINVIMTFLNKEQKLE
jgi:hypothetical protein